MSGVVGSEVISGPDIGYLRAVPDTDDLNSLVADAVDGNIWMRCKHEFARSRFPA